MSVVLKFQSNHSIFQPPILLKEYYKYNMKSIPENLFLKLPILLQNVALTLYGSKLQYIRYRGEYHTYFKDAVARLKLGQSELEEYCWKRLRHIIHEAAAYVPYYTELFKTNCLTPEDIRSVDDLKKIPLLEKTPIRKNHLIIVNKR